MGKSANPRKVTLPIPRCPFCYTPMEECQLKFFESPKRAGVHIWHEQWGCKGCHTQHTFPARIEFFNLVRDSRTLPMGSRTVYPQI